MKYDKVIIGFNFLDKFFILNFMLFNRSVFQVYLSKNNSFHFRILGRFTIFSYRSLDDSLHIGIFNKDFRVNLLFLLIQL